MLTKEQLEARRAGIGGSDAAAVVGLSRWRTPMDVYLDKIGASEEVEQNEAMYWGSKLETALRERFAEEHPELVVIDGASYGTVTSTDFPFVIANVDAMCYERGEDNSETCLTGMPVAGWEGKTASLWKKAEWDGESVPAEYWLQCQHYMLATGKPRWYLSVLIGGQEYREWVVERDEEAIASLLDQEQAFWALVESETPPPIDSTEASKKVLDRLYPASEAVLDPVLQLDDEASTLAVDRVRLKKELKALEDELRLVENKLKEKLGDRASAVTPDGHEITWKPQHKDSYVVKEQDYRVLRVKLADEEGA